MAEKTGLLHYITKSGFVRSVFLRVLSIFIIVSIAIAAVAFFSFASEINRSILDDRYKQLAVAEDTITKRLGEISSIAYSVGGDSTFYLEPVEGVKYSGYEMSSALARYLVGNSFIEHLAYYRLSEPDKIYVSGGERSFSEFWKTSLGLSDEAAGQIIRGIRQATRTKVVYLSFADVEKSYFAYTYPLPQLSAEPKAFVLMLIPGEAVEPLMQSLLTYADSEAAVYDASGNLVYRVGTPGDELPLTDFVQNDAKTQSVSVNGRVYVLQKVVSDENGWTYVSAIRRAAAISGLANKLLVFILLLLLLMLLAIVALLFTVIAQYRPIRNLAVTVADQADGGKDGAPLDEGALLSSAIASLKDDSEQKQRFETAYHEAQAANKAKSAFLSNMSHDIRTPMNAVIGMTALASSHADDPVYVRECLQKVQVASRYLLDIINNVLDMSRIESGRIELSEEVIDLPALVTGLTTILRQSVDAKRQELTVEVEPLRDERVLGDSTKLLQVFVNILSNSVKFTPEGGSIRLRVCQTVSDDPQRGRYEFTFSDTGIGMSPAFVERVFDTFSRADVSGASRVEGTGLGMAIAKNMVELMGGSIACESELGKGTVFTVSMPMKPAPESGQPRPGGGFSAADTAPLPEACVPDLSGRRVLLAEDNAMNREIACRVIAETKAQTVTAANGQEAVEAFRAAPAWYFDVVLMDLQMPVMDGYEAVAAIRGTPREDAASIPVYAMTANTFDEDVRRVWEAGMNGHIGKPYMPETLYEILRQACRR